MNYFKDFVASQTGEVDKFIGLVHLGKAYRENNIQDKALKVFDKAKEIYSKSKWLTEKIKKVQQN